MLSYIDHELATALPLELLAALAGMPLLRFLRSFAAACGFTHQSHLGALLKRDTGLSPAQYRKQSNVKFR